MRHPLRVLGWWIRDYAYAAMWQVRAFVDRTDPAVYLTGDRAPLLILPGVYEAWQFMRPLIETASARGHPVHAVSALRSHDLQTLSSRDQAGQANTKFPGRLSNRYQRDCCSDHDSTIRNRVGIFC